MSRNYELLQQAGKEHEVFKAHLEAQEGVERAVNILRRDAGVDAPEKEEITKLVQRVFLLPSPAPRMVVFSSAEEGSGCSWVTARAARVLSSLVPGSVCVLDANLRSPDLHEHFAVQNHRGLTDAVLQSGPIRDFTQQLLGGNLWLMTGGSPQSNSHTILASDRMYARMAELRQEFDYVLVDTPALNPYNDAIVLGHGSDGLVLILKANSSRREAARKTLQDLSAANVRVLGTVLNQRTFPIPERVYRKL